MTSVQWSVPMIADADHKFVVGCIGIVAAVHWGGDTIAINGGDLSLLRLTRELQYRSCWGRWRSI